MAAPTGVVAIYKNLIITVDTSFEVASSYENTLVGVVEAIGDAVTRCAVGNIVLFKPISSFVISEVEWQMSNEENILFIYTAPS